MNNNYDFLTNKDLTKAGRVTAGMKELQVDIKSIVSNLNSMNIPMTKHVLLQLNRKARTVESLTVKNSDEDYKKLLESLVYNLKS